MDERLQKYDNKMQKSFENLLEEFGSIRAGRANPHVLDKIKVDYYGTPTVPDLPILSLRPQKRRCFCPAS